MADIVTIWFDCAIAMRRGRMGETGDQTKVGGVVRTLAEL